MRSGIEVLLAQPEGKTLEFKQDLSSPRNLLRTLVAFANSAGGVVLIGVDDDRHVVGVEQPLDDEERLNNLIADSIAPRLVPNVEILSVGDRSVLAVEVFPGSIRPYYLKSEGWPDGVLVRLGSSNRQAGPALAAELRRTAEGVNFDEMPMSDLSVDDLDIAEAQRLFGSRRLLNEQALLSLRVLVRDQGRLLPTRGGMLLFGRNREFHFPDAWVQCGRFAGRDKAHIVDHTEIHASLPGSVWQTMDFLKKHALRGADFSDVQRKDVWSIPLVILREAITNALVHADYSLPGSPIRVAIFDDRIEVESPGILVPGMTIDDMRRGVSNLRNRVIARVFRELGLIEQWGSGVRRMLNEARQDGLPEPLIEEIGMHLRLTVFLAQNRLMQNTVRSAGDKSAGDKSAGDKSAGDKSAGDKSAGDKSAGDKSAGGQVEETGASQPIEMMVLRLLDDAPLSTVDIARALGKPKPSRHVRNVVRRLVAAGDIAYLVPDRPRSRFQQYRLTEQGLRRIGRG